MASASFHPLSALPLSNYVMLKGKQRVGTSAVSIYALCEQSYTSLLVKYVGRALHPKSRRGEHMQDSVYNRSCKQKWIRELRTKSKTPLLIILAVVPPERAVEEEKRWIKHFQELGCPLTNSISFLNATPPKAHVLETQDMGC